MFTSVWETVAKNFLSKTAYKEKKLLRVMIKFFKCNAGTTEPSVQGVHCSCTPTFWLLPLLRHKLCPYFFELLNKLHTHILVASSAPAIPTYFLKTRSRQENSKV